MHFYSLKDVLRGASPPADASPASNTASPGRGPRLSPAAAASSQVASPGLPLLSSTEESLGGIPPGTDPAAPAEASDATKKAQSRRVSTENVRRRSMITGRTPNILQEALKTIINPLHYYSSHDQQARASSDTHPSAANPHPHIDIKKMQRLDKRSQSQKLVHQQQARQRSEKTLWMKQMEQSEHRVTDLVGQTIGYGSIPPGQIDRPGSCEGQLSSRTVDIAAIGESDLNQTISIQGRVHVVRRLRSSFQFIVIRQDGHTIQTVLKLESPPAQAAPDTLATFFRWLSVYAKAESIVEITGKVVTPANFNSAKGRPVGLVEGATVKHVEILVSEIWSVSRAERVPFSVYQAELTDRFGTAKLEDDLQGLSLESKLKAPLQQRHKRHHQPVTTRTRQTNRVMDIRTASSGAVMRIQSAVSTAFRAHLGQLGFVEIHTPKLQAAATESGASVFRVDYFGRPAFLAQSPQLAKQLAITGDLNRVFEIGPVFRAENSNTHRHLTEFTGLDLEMAIKQDYHEVLDVLDSTFKAIFKHVYDTCSEQIRFVKQRYPHEDLLILDKTPRFIFAEAVRMLNDSGWRTEAGEELKEDEDLSTRDEIQLGKIVRERFKTDYYIIDKFPAKARPFYAMPDPTNPAVTNSFDIFLRGQEILSGGQRIHNAEMLRDRMRKNQIDPSSMAEYMSGFEFAAPPHGGGGIGLERMVFLLLGLDDIRRSTMFPRDPRSFPLNVTNITDLLRYPQANTLEPSWDITDPNAAPPLSMLIANYGDATNTSWLEERTQIWRHLETGAAVGFVPIDGYAIIAGNPLCHPSLYPIVAKAFLDYITDPSVGLKPIWILVGDAMASFLQTHYWRVLTVTSEQRIDPGDVTRSYDPHLSRKIAKTDGKVKFIDFDIGEPVPAELQRQVNDGIKRWHESRQGRKQVHLTDINMGQDTQHRSTHIAVVEDSRTGEQKPVAVVRLALLAPRYGVQVKYSIDFPGSPSGTIEALLMHVFEYVSRKEEGLTLSSRAMRTISFATVKPPPGPVKSAEEAGMSATANPNLTVTFGSGATTALRAGRYISPGRAKFLEVMYKNIFKIAGLGNKSAFREKLGTVQDPTWVCYPFRGLSYPALLKFFGYELDWMGVRGRMKIKMGADRFRPPAIFSAWRKKSHSRAGSGDSAEATPVTATAPPTAPAVAGAKAGEGAGAGAGGATQEKGKGPAGPRPSDDDAGHSTETFESNGEQEPEAGRDGRRSSGSR